MTTLPSNIGLEPTTKMHHPPDSRLEFSAGSAIVHMPGSAGVALDERLAALWQTANNKSESELRPLVETSPEELHSQLTVLRAAQLLLPPLDLQADADEMALPVPLPLVSVIIVSRDGRHHLEECLPSLMAQTYPRLELVLVDDRSTDGTATFVQEHFPSVRLLQQTGEPNFAAGNNQGLAQATGDLFFLLNNDTILEADCITELVLAQAQHPRPAAAAAMLRFYNNRPFLNGLGSSIRKFGFGYDLGIGSLDLGQFEQIRQVPLLCFGAALIPRAIFEQVGPIEESYGFYYEDADWSYRARAMGFDLIAAPRAKVYHKFGASTGLLPSAFKTRLATRNKVLFATKNLPWHESISQLFLYWLNDTAQVAAYVWRRQGKLALATARGWINAAFGMPKMLRIRRKTWRGIMRHPVNLSQLAHPFPYPEMYGAIPRLSQDLVAKQHHPFLISSKSSGVKQRLLIISPDAVGSSMGGVGIRYWELANQLAQSAEVTLAVPGKTDLSSTIFTVSCYEEGKSITLEPLVDEADIVLLSGFTVFHHPFLRKSSQYIVIDLYDPMILENLERFSSRDMDERNGLHQLGVQTFNELFALGDYFICASEKQRDYWLGALSSANRVNPGTYDADPTLRNLIDTVPFGLPGQPPQKKKSVLKGIWPGIGADDKVILWGGGLWDWLDPLTIIEAMPQVITSVPKAKLFFLGTKHPNPNVPMSGMASEAIQLAESLGLKDRAVFFNDWTPYLDRVDYLMEADVGVSLHGDHIETRFSVRTRLMDYLWARLPMVVGGGDILSELVKSHHLGMIAAAGDTSGVADSVVKMLQSPPDPTKFDQVTSRFHWAVVSRPLKKYVRSPWRNGKTDNFQFGMTLKPQATPLKRLPAKAIESLRQQGLGGLKKDIYSYLRWLSQH